MRPRKKVNTIALGCCVVGGCVLLGLSNPQQVLLVVRSVRCTHHAYARKRGERGSANGMKAHSLIFLRSVIRQRVRGGGEERDARGGGGGAAARRAHAQRSRRGQRTCRRAATPLHRVCR